MTVSDGRGQRQNMQYLIGFIGTRDGRAAGTFFNINTLTAHTRRRRSNVAFPRRFIGRSACASIRRSAIRGAETHVSLRFPWILGHSALSAYACAAKRPEDAKEQLFFNGILGRSGPGREPSEGGKQDLLAGT